MKYISNSKLNEKNYSKAINKEMDSFYNFVAISYLKKNNIINKDMESYIIDMALDEYKKDIESHFKSVINGIENWNKKLKAIQEAAREYKPDSKDFDKFIKNRGLEITSEDRINMYWYQTFQSFKQGKPGTSILYITQFKDENGLNDKNANNLFNRLLMGEDLYNKTKAGYKIPNKGIKKTLHAVGDFFRAIGHKLRGGKDVYEEPYGRQSSHFSSEVDMHYGYDFNDESVKKIGIRATVMAYGQLGDGGAIYSKPESHGANPKNFKEFLSHGIEYFKGDKYKNLNIKHRENDINPALEKPYTDFFKAVAKDISKSDNPSIPKKTKGFIGKLMNRIRKQKFISKIFRYDPLEKICDKAKIHSNKDGNIVIENGATLSKIEKFVKYCKSKNIAQDAVTKFEKELDNFKGKFTGGHVPQGDEVINNITSESLKTDTIVLDNIRNQVNNGAEVLANLTARGVFDKGLYKKDEELNKDDEKVKRALLSDNAKRSKFIKFGKNAHSQLHDNKVTSPKDSQKNKNIAESEQNIEEKPKPRAN